MRYLSPLFCGLVLFLSPLVRADDPAATDPDKAPELKATVPADFVKHATRDKNVTIKSPADWKDTAGGGPNCKLTLMADNKGRNVNVSVTPNNDRSTLEQARKELPKGLAGSFKDFKLITCDFVKLSSKPALHLVYTMPVKGSKLQFCQYILLRGESVYIFTYTSPPDDYAALLPTVEKVAVSMKVP